MLMALQQITALTGASQQFQSLNLTTNRESQFKESPEEEITLNNLVGQLGSAMSIDEAETKAARQHKNDSDESLYDEDLYDEAKYIPEDNEEEQWEKESNNEKEEKKSSSTEVKMKQEKIDQAQEMHIRKQDLKNRTKSPNSDKVKTQSGQAYYPRTTKQTGFNKSNGNTPTNSSSRSNKGGSGRGGMSPISDTQACDEGGLGEEEIKRKEKRKSRREKNKKHRSLKGKRKQHTDSNNTLVHASRV